MDTDDPHGPKNWKKGSFVHEFASIFCASEDSPLPFKAKNQNCPRAHGQSMVQDHGRESAWSREKWCTTCTRCMHLLALLHKRENLTQNVKNSPGKPQKMLDETRHSHRDQRRMLKSKICSTKFEIEKLIFINSLMLQHCSLLLTLSLCCLFCHPRQ